MSHTVRRRKSHTAWHKGKGDNLARDAQPAPRVALAKPAPAKAEPEQLVTDHAVLRWLERVTGIDVATQVREEILAGGRAELIRTVGKGKIRVHGSNVSLVVAAGRVITVVVEGGGHG